MADDTARVKVQMSEGVGVFEEWQSVRLESSELVEWHVVREVGL